MAERSKALVSGTSLFGGVGSNPTSVTTFLAPADFYNLGGKNKRQAVISAMELSRLAQLVERKTLNLVVVGSSPTVGIPFFFCRSFRAPAIAKAGPATVLSLLWRSWQRVGLIILRSRVRSSPGAVIFFPFSNTDLQLRSCFFVLATDFGWMAERSKALV